MDKSGKGGKDGGGGLKPIPSKGDMPTQKGATGPQTTKTEGGGMKPGAKNPTGKS